MDFRKRKIFKESYFLAIFFYYSVHSESAVIFSSLLFCFLIGCLGSEETSVLPHNELGRHLPSRTVNKGLLQTLASLQGSQCKKLSSL